MLEHSRPHLHISAEAIIGVVFGILTLTATLASIQFKDSIVRLCCTPRRLRASNDVEANAGTTLAAWPTRSIPLPHSLELYTLPSIRLHWPSPYEISGAQIGEWDRVWRGGSVEEITQRIGPFSGVMRLLGVAHEQ
ncbi:hypothetical protein BU16DRAFT_144852 [Lophium mytilinum]|uniref:Uncharacterized protein n=1 Tax=Lophium mytilinum TaxID=390894 RepID=A0A6A6QGL4_9PEZI|nr:hypothetical protein BU16DRAFT_144852 [Lophium mytilinum]